MALLLFAFATASARIASAAEFVGRVVGVNDGDTITVFDVDKKRHQIRLAAVDAPEQRQAYGAKSKQNLSDLVFGKDVAVIG